MSDVTSQELRIVGFLCNWCSYGGADTAGVARAKQPTDLRIIRVPCSGRVDPLFILRALFNGADGVLVSGCHPRDCHYSTGNFYARRRLEVLKNFLPILGIDSRRFEYTWVSASEGQRWQQVVTKFTEQIHSLGRATPFMEVPPKPQILKPHKTDSRLPLGSGEAQPLDKLKAALKEKIEQLDVAIGWQHGRDLAHAVPLFMHTKDDVDKLIWGPLTSQNLATYLKEYQGKKVGLVVKACDVRSVIELVQENLIKREDVTLFTMPCQGCLDTGRVDEALGRYHKLTSAKLTPSSLKIEVDDKSLELSYKDYAQAKCLTCTERLSTQADLSFGEAPKSCEPASDLPPELALVESLSLEDRRSFWRDALERCIRCGACRNACPMCVCRDHCISDTRDPHFMTQKDTALEKLFFQVIHAMHLAGRCTECGECQRVCPMGIPILALRQKINRIIADLFDGYKAGIDPTNVPPLLGYAVEENHIKEREW